MPFFSCRINRIAQGEAQRNPGSAATPSTLSRRARMNMQNPIHDKAIFASIIEKI